LNKSHLVGQLLNALLSQSYPGGESRSLIRNVDIPDDIRAIIIRVTIITVHSR